MLGPGRPRPVALLVADEGSVNQPGAVPVEVAPSDGPAPVREDGAANPRAPDGPPDPPTPPTLDVSSGRPARPGGRRRPPTNAARCSARFHCTTGPGGLAPGDGRSAGGPSPSGLGHLAMDHVHGLQGPDHDPELDDAAGIVAPDDVDAVDVLPLDGRLEFEDRGVAVQDFLRVVEGVR